ncbi:MAG TPA: histidine kinase N-terminal 7TM domain-containing protein, partial [Spirochaetia bacterium]
MILVVGILAATALLSGQLAAYILLRSRGSRTAILLGVTMAATAWWAAGNAVEDLVTGLAAKLVCTNLEYLAIAAIPVLWGSLGWSLDREERRGTPKTLPLPFWIIPAVTAILVWIDPVLGLVRSSFHLETIAGFTSLAKRFGPWFWVHSVYSYGLMIAGTVFLIRALSAGPSGRRVQHVILIVGSLLPLVANVVYVAKLVPLRGVDPTPLAFSVSGLLLVLGLTSFRFLSLMTVAQRTAVEQLREPVLVLDRQGQLAYANGAARDSFAIAPVDIGRPVAQLETLQTALHHVVAGSDNAAEVGTTTSLGNRLYEMRTGDILRGGRSVGSVVTLFDVTRRVNAEEELRRSNLLLEQRIAERTRALEEMNARLSGELEQRRRAERQLAQDVLHDSLTGLPNRNLASSRIEQLIFRMRREPSLSSALLFMNFDGFMDINDAWGHAAGDLFLSQMAARLTSSVREVDLAARVGGDEFVALLDGIGDPSSVEHVVERIQDHLCVPLSLGAATVVPSVSIGIAIATSTCKDPESLLHDAEIAMQRAKSSGRNLRVFFTEEMRQQAQERNTLITALRTAIATGGITLAFQPIVALGGAGASQGGEGCVEGWEVLARWRHERLGPVSPDLFISLAEESGLILPLGAFVLIETLKVAAALHAKGLLTGPGAAKRFFAVNVSAIQFEQPDFPDLVLSSLDRVG